jgi:hypothetical protein
MVQDHRGLLSSVSDRNFPVLDQYLSLQQRVCVSFEGARRPGQVDHKAFHNFPGEGGWIERCVRFRDSVFLSRWEDLTLFIDDGRIELDNNTVERSIRPIGLTRKNAPFAGSDGGAEHWATIASLIETSDR